MLKLVEGGYYIDQKGKVVGPMRETESGWWDTDESLGGWFEDGTSYGGQDPDLVEYVVELYNLREPLGLLEPWVRKALLESGGPWEYFDGENWCPCDSLEGGSGFVHRLRRGRDFWIVSGVAYTSLTDAIYDGGDIDEVIHVREVV